MVRFAFATLVSIAMIGRTSAADAAQWKPVEGNLMTKWAGDVDPRAPLPEYPRPQMVRDQWQNLNGLWDYVVDEREPQRGLRPYDGKILVPFCIESALSGVKKALPPDHVLWYQREFELPHDWKGQRILLHFGAVDWQTEVFVNGQPVGEHQGGYDPFTIDITEVLTDKPQQVLVVGVSDPTNAGWQPRGKQVREPNGIWYTSVTGIWQTVWIEPVPQRYVRGLKTIPDVDKSAVSIEADVVGDAAELEIQVLDGTKTVAESRGPAGARLTLSIAKPHLWSPDDPHLYDLKVRLRDGDTTVDQVASYFGMRKIAIGQHDGHTRILLNNQPLFQYGPLDQGFWPDGIYTAPTDEALVSDLKVLEQLGMNMLRKHVKVEPARYYYHCDRLGLLVWQDMPSGDKYIGGSDPDITRSEESAAGFQRELRAMIDALHNHPSIVLWVVYNEGWGQWDTARMADWVKNYDPTRLVDSASGWADRGVGDVIDAHVYPGPGMHPAEAKRASVLGEFGGLGWPVPEHLWWNKKNWGYRTFESREELNKGYAALMEQLPLLIGEGLSAAVYTQTSDVEGEVNGLMTYDRAVLKLDADRVAEMHGRLYRPPPKLVEIVPISRTAPQQWRYTLAKPAGDWTQPNFEDSSWKTGGGMFGSEGTPGVRVGTEWTTSDIWLRREFEWPADAPSGDVRLNIYHDEDAEVYINGVAAASLPRWVTRHILADIAPAAATTLRTGRNVLAVHCRQSDGGQGVDAGLCVIVEPVE